mgnify:CR=1 FL=1
MQKKKPFSGKITSFEKACACLGISTRLPGVSRLPERFRARAIADYKLCVITEAVNKQMCNGWEPDYTDASQWKYTPYFVVEKDKKSPAGVGFSHSTCDRWVTGSLVGSRLCLGSSDAVHFVNKHFKKIQIDHQLV